MYFRLIVRSNAYYYYVVTTGVFIVRVSNYVISIISRVKNKFIYYIQQTHTHTQVDME